MTVGTVVTMILGALVGALMLQRLVKSMNFRYSNHKHFLVM